MATGLIVIAKLVLADEQSTAGALFQTMTQIGAAIGLAINTIVYTSVEESKARQMGSAAVVGDGNYPPEAFRQGLKMAFYTAAAMGFVCEWARGGHLHIAHLDTSQLCSSALWAYVVSATHKTRSSRSSTGRMARRSTTQRKRSRGTSWPMTRRRGPRLPPMKRSSLLSKSWAA